MCQLLGSSFVLQQQLGPARMIDLLTSPVQSPQSLNVCTPGLNQTADAGSSQSQACSVCACLPAWYQGPACSRAEQATIPVSSSQAQMLKLCCPAAP